MPSAKSIVSLGAATFDSNSEFKNGFGYELGFAKEYHAFRFASIYSGFRLTYLPVQLNTRFIRNAPHTLLYLGVPVEMQVLYRGKVVEPFVSLETRIDYKALDFKKNVPDTSCDFGGTCVTYGPSIQPERYAQFIMRATPKVGSAFNIGKAKIFFAAGIRTDLTAFAIRGNGKTKTSSSLLETGVGF